MDEMTYLRCRDIHRRWGYAFLLASYGSTAAVYADEDVDPPDEYLAYLAEQCERCRAVSEDVWAAFLVSECDRLMEEYLRAGGKLGEARA
jgi:hypothetical protein